MRKLTLLVAILILLVSCKVTQINHQECKNKKNCPHTNKRYYLESKKNKNVFW